MPLTLITDESPMTATNPPSHDRIQRSATAAADDRSAFRRSGLSLLIVASVCVHSIGCMSLRNPFRRKDVDEYGLTAGADRPDFNPIRQVSAVTDRSTDPASPDYDPNVIDASGSDKTSIADRTSTMTKSMTNFLTGKQQEDRNKAKDFYKEGDRLFREASSQPIEQRRSTFKAAGKKFKKAAEAAPGSALEQDALFMQAESQFFADRLTLAADTYQKLQKEFPRNRHNDRVAARLFSISRYWIDTAKADENGWMKINLTDSSRPRVDTDGHAIRVLDQIRYDDPTGRLADDATMAAAAEYIRQEKFEEADEFLTDLRETFSDSEHLFLAHLLGIRVKLEVYAGPRYSGLVLEEAETLVRQTRQRFPDKMAEEKYGEMVARAAAEIQYHRAERLAYRASFNEKQQEYGAARHYYERLQDEFADTPQAEIAEKRMDAVETLPARPTRRLSWLTTIFPESRPRKPLEMTFTDDPDAVPPDPTSTIEVPTESESIFR